MLLTLLFASALLISLVLAVPALIYAVECLSGALPIRKPGHNHRASRPSVGVIVPAHDEESGIGATLSAIHAQLRPGDRLIVVADNCSDRTAELARKAGAEVVERMDALRRGKGYALDAGLRHLETAPCPFAMIVDADCILDPDGLDALVALAAATGRPVQGRNLMKAPPNASPEVRVAEFAFLVKNLVRPVGLARLGLPCPLMGTGMVIPLPILRHTNLATGHVVEDLKLSFDVAQLGFAPLLCPDHGITSYFPLSVSGARAQRQRWEGGHIEVIRASFPYLLRPGSIRSFPALVLLLDRVVPPTTLLFILLTAWTLPAVGLAIIGASAIPAIIAAGSTVLAFGATLLVWFLQGRGIIPARTLATVPMFVFRKLGFYRTLATEREARHWVRADRGR